VKHDIKILVLADFLHPQYTGGSPRLASEFNRQLVNLKFELSCITRIKSGIYSTNASDIKNYNCIEFGNLKKMIELTKIKFDYLIVHHFSLGLLFPFFRFKKMTYFYHGPVGLEYRISGGNLFGKYLRSALELLLLFRSDSILVLSDYMKLKIPTFLHNKVLVTGPLHVNSYRPVVKDLDFLKENRKIRLLTVRRLTNRTGVSELIQLCSKIPDYIELTVVGTGENLESIMKYKFSNVKILGFIDESTLTSTYEQADIFILPSIDLEGFGLVVLEAISNNTPVIVSTNSGGAREFLEPISDSFVFNLNDHPYLFLNKIKNAIENFHDLEIKSKILEKLKNSEFEVIIPSIIK
jgi:glycosyltransferase involved in cell wall biosynthesis